MGVVDISVCLEELEEYFSKNKIAGEGKLSIFNYSFKAKANVWFQSVASPDLSDTPAYDTLVTKFKAHFKDVRDKATLRRET